MSRRRRRYYFVEMKRDGHGTREGAASDRRARRGAAAAAVWVLVTKAKGEAYESLADAYTPGVPPAPEELSDYGKLSGLAREYALTVLPVDDVVAGFAADRSGARHRRGAVRRLR